MVCQFLLYNKVNHLYVYLYPHIPSLLRLPPTLPIPPLQVVTKQRADLPVLCGCFPLATYFTFGSVFMSMPLSHFVPVYPSPSPCPQVHSLCLHPYSCPQAHFGVYSASTWPTRRLAHISQGCWCGLKCISFLLKKAFIYCAIYQSHRRISLTALYKYIGVLFLLILSICPLTSLCTQIWF